MTATPSAPPVLGVDFSYARPTVAQITALGASWVARYLSPDPGKNLSPAELGEYLQAGLAVVLVWESTATRAQQGFTAGHNDAHAALAQRAALGIPSSVPIYFAVDSDTSWSAVEPYFAGAEQAVGVNRAGVYGGLQVVQGAANAGFRYLWQTEAWSGGQWSPQALIRQQGSALHGAVDNDFGMAVDFGQYPNPVPSEDDFMALFSTVADFQKAVADAVASVPARDAVAYADLWWLDHALRGEVPAGASKGQATLINDLHRLITQLAATAPLLAAHTVATAALAAPSVDAAAQVDNAAATPDASAQVTPAISTDNPTDTATDSSEPATDSTQAV